MKYMQSSLSQTPDLASAAISWQIMAKRSGDSVIIPPLHFDWVLWFSFDMGLGKNAVRALRYAQKQGVDFSAVATIGRLLVHAPNEESYFAESLFETTFGASTVHSFDVSDYEGASHIHDFNLDIPDSLEGSYSVVVDGGALEHVFNFPTAIKNCMRMLRVGGHYIGISPTNNFCGHGFYQLSPELYFTAFSEANGFGNVSVFAYEHKPTATSFYRVMPPIAARERVTIQGRKPYLLFVMAQKTRVADVFAQFPQQSDYLPLWEQSFKPQVPAAHAPIAPRPFIIRASKRVIPASWRMALRGAQVRASNLIREARSKPDLDPRFFHPIDI